MKVKTNYGEMNLETIDGKTRMVGSGERKTPAAGERSAGHRPACASGTHAEPTTRTLHKGSSLSSGVDEFDSKLEAKRARHWAMLVLAGEIRRYKYHPFTVPIGPKRTYTPDFLVEYPDRRIVIEEVKGSLKMKNARDSVTRAHAAAGLLPSFSWRLVLGDDMEERWIAEA